MHLLYFADPMCSWCYGFGPELSKLLDRHPDTRLDLVMGGLRPFNRERMTAEFREMLRGHWRHVAQASGLPFSETVLDRDDFLYDTEPACRAVVTARDLDVSKSYAFMKAVQLAFYRDGRDVTQREVLAQVAAESGYDEDTFRMAFDTDHMREETQSDFATAKTLGVSGFPTLAITHGAQLYLVTSGYVTEDVLDYRIAEIARLAEQKKAGGARA